MTALQVSPTAAADLDRIWCDRERTRDADAADALADRFEAAFDEARRRPASGPPQPDIAPDLRMTVVDGYRVYFRVEPDAVTVMRVLHARQDERAAFVF